MGPNNHETNNAHTGFHNKSNTANGSGPQQPSDISRHNNNRSSQNSQKKNSNGNNRNSNPPDYRIQEVTALVNKFPPIQVNGKEFDPAHKRAITSFIRQSLPGEDIYLVLNIVPSDPDFPFELESLRVSLNVPINYPLKKNRENVQNNRPSIVVLNSEIPRGITYNIESGFRSIVQKACVKKGSKGSSNKPGKEPDLDIKIIGGNNLVGLIQTLDKYLEVFLSQKKRDTFKIVKNISKPKTAKASENVDESDVEQSTNKFIPHSTAINVSRQDIKELDETLELISYRLNRATDKKRFALYENHQGVGYIYNLRLDAESSEELSDTKNDFDLAKATKMFTGDFNALDTTVRLFIPLNIKQNPNIQIISFDVPSSDGQAAKNLDLDKEDHQMLFQTFLTNVKFNFNDKSKSVLESANGSIFSVLNFLNSKFFELGLNGNLF